MSYSIGSDTEDNVDEIAEETETEAAEEEEVVEEEVAEEEATEEEATEEITEEGEESTEEIEAEAGDKIPVPLIDENGKEYIEEIDYEDLVKIIQDAKRGAAKGDKPDAGAKSPQGDSKELANLLTEIEKNQMIQNIIGWQSQGFSDEQIIEGMFKLHSEAKAKAAEEPPEFDTISDEVNYYIEKRYGEEIKSLNNQINQLKSKETGAMVEQNNDSVIAQSLQRFGHSTHLEREGLVSLRGAYDKLYPNVDLKNFMLSPDQADALVYLALGSKEGSETASKKKPSVKETIEAITRMASAPKTLKGRSTKPTATNNKQQYDNVSHADRVKRMNDLF